VQETDHYAPVRGARIVLADDDGVRAAMTGSWLAQMGWEVHVLAQVPGHRFTETGPAPRPAPPAPSAATVTPDELASALAGGLTAVLDVGPSAGYRAGHVPGAWHTSRSQLAEALRAVAARRYVFTAPDEALARFAAADANRLTSAEVAVLAGGLPAWRAAGRVVSADAPRFAAPPVDSYRRPYEGTDNPVCAMQDYLHWEYGLVAQLDRDGTHNFRVL